MMRNPLTRELLIGSAFVLLVLVLLNPFHLPLPPSLMMACLFISIILLIAFLVLLLQEKTRDEREEYHKMLTARIGFLSGLVVLLGGIITQTLLKMPRDPWLVGALCFMIVIRMVGAIIADRKQ